MDTVTFPFLGWDCITSVPYSNTSSSDPAADVRGRNTRRYKLRRVFVIYALAEPGQQPFYVGFTSRSLNTRLGEHVRDARGSGRRKCRTAPAHIRKMRVRPVISGLAEVTTRDEALRQEERWIRHGYAVGWPLVNCRPSGG